MNKQINYILASSSNHVIELNKLTTNNMVIMGSNTFNLLNNKPLENRLNIVITSKYEEYQNQSNLIFLSSIENAIYYGQINPSINTIWIIGSEAIRYNIASEESYLYEQIDKIKPDNIYINIEIESKIQDKISLSDQFFKYIEENYNSILIETNNYYDEISNQELKCDYFHYTIINKEIINIKNIIHSEFNYLNLLKNTLLYGSFKATRNDYTWSDFGSQIEFNMKDGFPLLTTKKMPFKMIFEELMFFINGYTDNKILKEKNIHIWDLNTTSEFIESNKKYYQIQNKLLDEDDMGPMYGFQWRHYNANYDKTNNIENEIMYKNLGIDQLDKVINELLNDPFSRRILMTSFNPEQVEYGVLYPCHSLIIQFYCTQTIDNNLNVSIKMYQRSADLFLGLPFNIASTALLLNIICDYLNKKSNNYIYHPDRVIITLGDTYIYQSHINAVLLQLQNQPKKFPKLAIKINYYENITDYTFNDMILEDYNHCGLIKAKMIA